MPTVLVAGANRGLGMSVESRIEAAPRVGSGLRREDSGLFFRYDGSIVPR